MTALADTDRAFWRGVLEEAGRTSVPRWTAAPVPGAAALTTPVPPADAEAVRRLAAALGVAPTAVLLAAHARVLAALAGEPEVVAGYCASAGAEPLPCRIATGVRSWRGLVDAAAQVEAAVLTHADFPVGALRRDLGLPAAFETVLAPGDAALAAEAVLQVGYAVDGAGDTLVLRYRTDALDAGCAERIAG